VSRIVIGAEDEKRGYSRVQSSLLHPKTRLTTGVLADESRALLQRFFGRMRL
jgi:tRNA(adenine34) deaminase